MGDTLYRPRVERHSPPIRLSPGVSPAYRPHAAPASPDPQVPRTGTSL